MLWGDTSRLGRPFAKDPSVIRFHGKYWLYYSLPGIPDDPARTGWGIGIARSTNLIDWTKAGELTASTPYESRGLCAPCAKVIAGRVHLFYQTYGNGPKDAICHAVSEDGLTFARDQTNPVFRPEGSWNAGRAIDADIFEFRGRWFLYAATRDPAMKVQMLVGAVAEADAGFGRGAWKMLKDAPLLKPELPWERDCIEAPTVLRRGDELVMFYAGGYNNAPQQVGCAVSRDGVEWKRLFTEPFLPNGRPDEWNASESGHPCAFLDDNGRTYLFFQGNNDNGRTWFLSHVAISWRGNRPFLENTP
jgi:beta-1,2-mannobiose phosphorylase / 1,2-beta-oligomannan phosphorylase